MPNCKQHVLYLLGSFEPIIVVNPFPACIIIRILDYFISSSSLKSALYMICLFINRSVTSSMKVFFFAQMICHCTNQHFRFKSPYSCARPRFWSFSTRFHRFFRLLFYLISCFSFLLLGPLFSFPFPNNSML